MFLSFGVLTLGCLGYFLTEALRAPVIEADQDPPPVSAAGQFEAT